MTSDVTVRLTTSFFFLRTWRVSDTETDLGAEMIPGAPAAHRDADVWVDSTNNKKHFVGHEEIKPKRKQQACFIVLCVSVELCQYCVSALYPRLCCSRAEHVEMLF